MYYHSNNILKEIKIKNHATYYFDDIIVINVINDRSPDNVLIEEKQHENILIYNVAYKAPNNSRPLYFFFDKAKDILKIIFSMVSFKNIKNVLIELDNFLY